MANKKTVGSSGTSKRRGGRRPGTWVHVQPEELRAFRERHELSRARLAAALAVSATSIQNWELGKVASARAQLELRELIDGRGPAAIALAKDASAPSVDHGRAQATAAIVSAYLETDGEMPPEGVPDLVRAVRAALA